MSPELQHAWMEEPDQTLKASILLAAAKKLKNKDLPAHNHGESRSQQIYATDLDPNDDHSLDDSTVCSDYATGEYKTFSVDQYGQPYLLLQANASAGKPTSILKVPQPKPKKTDIPPAGAMRLLADTKTELRSKDGTLYGYFLQHATPKQIETDKESRTVPSSKSKSS